MVNHFIHPDDHYWSTQCEQMAGYISATKALLHTYDIVVASCCHNRKEILSLHEDLVNCRMLERITYNRGAKTTSTRNSYHLSVSRPMFLATEEL